MGRWKHSGFSIDQSVFAPKGDNTGRNTSIEGYYSMVVDGEGKVCQEKTAVPSANLFTAGDGIVPGPGGSVVWANDESGGITVITLTP